MSSKKTETKENIFYRAIDWMEVNFVSQREAYILENGASPSHKQYNRREGLGTHIGELIAVGATWVYGKLRKKSSSEPRTDFDDRVDDSYQGLQPKK